MAWAAAEGAFAHRAGPALPSYLALHHAGFSRLPVLLPGRWALTPPFHPCQTTQLCEDVSQVSLCRCRYRHRGGLLPHLFTLACARSRKPSAVVFCGTLCNGDLTIAVPRRYLATCPAEPGLSSGLLPRPSGRKPRPRNITRTTSNGFASDDAVMTPRIIVAAVGTDAGAGFSQSLSPFLP